MELTAELFRAIVESPEEPTQVLRAREQRRTPRRRLDVRATLVPVSDALSHAALPVAIRNLSRGGFAFLHDRSLPLNEPFVLAVPDASAGWPVPILCTVAYWQPLADELYVVGAKFTRVLRAGPCSLPLDLEDLNAARLPELRKAS